uniref:Uncharacterized protein n=1 Tax=Rhizophora mucronata TaxID=61149 RepID=A0A2P2PD80_RHIMU
MEKVLLCNVGLALNCMAWRIKSHFENVVLFMIVLDSAELLMLPP